jgi:ribosome-binding protein aMBF1 (putative translation factor)
VGTPKTIPGLPENKPRFALMKTIPAVLPLPTAPKPVAQPKRTKVTFRLDELECEKYGLENRYRAAMKRREHRAARKLGAEAALSESISRLVERAQSEHWSQRELAGKVGIPETTFRRIRNHQVNALVWEPKLKAVLDRLNPA